jgi:glc operon protein GlcG
MKKGLLTAWSMVLTAVIAFSFTAECQLATKKALTLEAARKVAAAAETEAVKNHWTMVITVVDDGGNLILLEKMDGTQIGSIELAVQKAKTAISFKRPTKAFEEMVLGGRTSILGLQNAIPIEGGLPLIVDGRYIGAIGVSGGSSEQDGIVAKAGSDALPAR